MVLKGVRVVDLSRILSGPFCTMVLGDLGADIIKVEHPSSGDENRSVITYPGRTDSDEDYFYPINRNKRSISIDLKSELGVDLLKRIVAKSDVLVENFAPGVAARLGIDYEQMKMVNPRLIYCAISGFGQTGANAHRKAYDSIVQALAGTVSVTGYPGEEPLKPGFMFGDLGAALYGALAILAATFHRRRSGEGQYLDVSMMESSASFWATSLSQGWEQACALGDRDRASAVSGAFKTQDGRFLYISVSSDPVWRDLATALGWSLQGLSDRSVEQARELLSDWISETTLEQCESVLRSIGCPCGPVNSVEQVAESAQAVARELLIQLDHPVSGRIRQFRSAIRFVSETETTPLSPPLLSQHATELLEWLEALPGEIERFKTEAGVSVQNPKGGVSLT